MSRKPELMSPAGDRACMRAAIENGADSIYFGLERFNARMRAENFTMAELPEIMADLHARGVKGYVTFNVLVFAHELREARELLEACIRAGVDAVIVQDPGMVRLARALSPDLPIHASTQMTVTGPEGVHFAEELGCDLVVLARETSIPELDKLRTQHPDLKMPLEMFVHGALCVAYSGQCLTSESLGGRSANRGECAQACRMPYELVADGKPVDLGDRHYLLSPQDLAGVEAIPDLIRLGISCLKIEGRLKAPEYVANITRLYRKAIDEAWEKHTVTLTEEDRYSMEMGFSRGLYPGWFHGVNHQELAHARFAKKRGVFLGSIASVGHDHFCLTLQGPLERGDGIVVDQGPETDREQGGRVWHIENRREESALFFEPGKIDFRKLRKGDRIWKTDDPRLNRQWRESFEGPKIRRKLRVDLAVSGREGQPLKVSAKCGGVRPVEAHVQSAMPLVRAEKRPLTVETLRDQLGRLGDTPLELGELVAELEGAVIVPISELNRMRRELSEKLESALRQNPSHRFTPQNADRLESGLFAGIKPAAVPSGPAPQLIALCRNPAQMLAALESGVSTVYLDFEDIRQYREAITRARHLHPQARLLVATPRIHKTGENGLFKLMDGCGADGILVRNYGALAFFSEVRRHGTPLELIGDFSLNVTNPLTADWFLQRGLDRLTVSYDLNAEQALALLRQSPADRFEMTLHQHMPMFHMEHCVFAAFLSKGADYRTCGRPCEKHVVHLKDRVGQLHPLKADVGCRNTLFNSAAQTGAEYFEVFAGTGLKRYRVEFVNEGDTEVRQTLDRYQSLLAGKTTGQNLWRDLKAVNQLGVTRGTMTLRSESHVWNSS